MSNNTSKRTNKTSSSLTFRYGEPRVMLEIG